ELLAALFKEFDETTPQNVDHGKQAISLIFNDLNRDMRLVGTFRPLLGKDNDRPNDSFENTALRLALTGHHRRAAGERHLVLSTLDSPQQYVSQKLRSLPCQLHTAIL